MAELDLTQMYLDIEALKGKLEEYMDQETADRIAGDDDIRNPLVSGVSGRVSALEDWKIEEVPARQQVKTDCNQYTDDKLAAHSRDTVAPLTTKVDGKLDKSAFDSYKREAETVHVRNMAMPAYWAHSDGGVSYQLLKYGKVVVLEGTLISTADRTAATNSGGNWKFVNIATGNIPDGFKPMKAARVVCQMSGSKQCKMNVDTAGAVTIDHIYDADGIVSVLPKGSYIWIHAVWLTN